MFKNLSADPKSLRPNPWNTNVVSPENETKLDESMKRLGVFKPIICRELADGSLEILGGEHRNDSAIRLGLSEIPVINLGRISDKRAKEVSLVDNGRYGADDTLSLAALLEDLGDVDELSSFMPYSDVDLTSIFASTSIALDELELPENEELPKGSLPEKAVQTHQVLRFKVPVQDAAELSALIEHIMKTQGFTTEDSLSNAGNALVHLLLGKK